MGLIHFCVSPPNPPSKKSLPFYYHGHDPNPNRIRNRGPKRLSEPNRGHTDPFHHYWIHDLGTFLGRSGKLKDKFKAIVAAEGEGPALSIRPLCPTRWTVHLLSVLFSANMGTKVLSALEEMAANHSESASRAEGLHVRLQQGNVVLGPLLALDVISELEVLNKSLQKKTQTMEGMLSAVSLVQDSLKSKRNTKHFRQSLRRQRTGVAICL